MNFTVRPYQPGEENYAAEAHKRVYTDEYHWGPAFMDYAVKIALDFARREKDAGEELWVAESEGKLIGCIMLCRAEEPSAGQLRLYLVEKDYRRCGVGSALVKALMEKARQAGYQKLILWTASPLHAAIHHYQKLGFRTVEEVENQTWRLDGGKLNEIKMEMSLQ